MHFSIYHQLNIIVFILDYPTFFNYIYLFVYYTILFLIIYIFQKRLPDVGFFLFNRRGFLIQIRNLFRCKYCSQLYSFIYLALFISFLYYFSFSFSPYHIYNLIEYLINFFCYQFWPLLWVFFININIYSIILVPTIAGQSIRYNE